MEGTKESGWAWLRRVGGICKNGDWDGGGCTGWVGGICTAGDLGGLVGCTG